MPPISTVLVQDEASFPQDRLVPNVSDVRRNVRTLKSLVTTTTLSDSSTTLNSKQLPPTPSPTPPRSPRAPPRSSSNAGNPTLEITPETPVATAQPAPTPTPTSEACLPTYDQYGFERSFTHTSLKNQLAYDSHYNALCEKRAAKWVHWLSKYNGGAAHSHNLMMYGRRANASNVSLSAAAAAANELMFPPPSEKVKRYLRKGVPHHLRKHVWFHYSGAEALWKEEMGLYMLLTCREEQDVRNGATREENEVMGDIVVIDRDVYRTFPDNLKFQPRPSTPPSPSHPHPTITTEQNPFLLSLRRILVAFAYYSRPQPNSTLSRTQNLRKPKYNIGYCQSLNFLAGFLLLVFADDDFEFETGHDAARLSVEERVFWMLVVVVEMLMPEEMYGATLEGARATQEVLWTHLVGRNGHKYGLEKVEKWLAVEEAAMLLSPITYSTAYSSSSPTTARNQPFTLKILQKRLPAKNKRPKHAEQQSTNPLPLLTTSWFLTLFTTTLPPHSLLRLWDMFTYQGVKVIYRFSMTLLSVHQRELLKTKLADLTAVRVVKSLPGRCYDVGVVVEMVGGAQGRMGGALRWGKKGTKPRLDAINTYLSPNVNPTSMSATSPHPSALLTPIEMDLTLDTDVEQEQDHSDADLSFPAKHHQRPPRTQQAMTVLSDDDDDDRAARVGSGGGSARGLFQTPPVPDVSNKLIGKYMEVAVAEIRRGEKGRGDRNGKGGV
ncbi:uncharacterized protein EV422DRAFT_285515 [Fimicolochytrium jonesii]|uniref:uncharacterized protein n=1 Tax=Fimicolochytrium jonesii TaxID=1396493 RepID=UPI0022FF0DCE|nr:uncharacterized protein EV422DRAFT_285515 [Fimicolochytrium jonesii]KAI8816494.1 hypothetical protein EV422DRAFT_285515 [Fimicolochytrium jonesii]